jgi:hypothetical protein
VTRPDSFVGEMLISERHDVLLGRDSDAAVGAIAVNAEAKNAAPWAGRDGEFETAFLDAAKDSGMCGCDEPRSLSHPRPVAHGGLRGCGRHHTQVGGGGGWHYM